MEGSQWFRLGVIVALFLGSFYVLLPTLFQVDPAQEAIDQIDGSGPTVDFDVEYALLVVEGDAEDVAPALEKRLLANGVGIDGVIAQGRRVVVRRDGTVSDQAILDHIGPAPVVALHPLGLELADDAPSTAVGLAGDPAISVLAGTPPAQPASSLTLQSLAGPTAVLSAAPGSAEALLVVVDDAIRGLIVPKVIDENIASTGSFAPMGGYDRLAEDLGAVALPGQLAAIEDSISIAEDTDTDGEAEGRGLPDWLLAVLPDTRMPLGLDLQGGIDMTIQVKLEEALLSQANRDITYLKDRAEEKGLTVTGVRRNKYDPIIEVDSPDGADALQGFFGQSMSNDYEYLDSITEDGSTWHQFAMTSTRAEEIRGQAITQVLDVLRKRVAETKVRDPVVVRKGAGRISVQLPGFSDTKTATAAIGKTAILEFKLVDPDFRRSEIPPLYSAARDAMQPGAFYNDELLNDFLHNEGLLPDDRELRFEYTVEKNEDGEPQRARRTPGLVVVKEVVLTGQDVNGADVGFDPQTQRPNVSLEFKPGGSTTFCEFTGEHVDDRFAIILDGEVQSAPSINERICGGRAQITMGQSIDANEEAKALAVVLRTGSLNAPVEVGSVRQIGPSLGAAAIQAGSIATVLAGSIVLIFMAVWYRMPGMLANVALVLNILLMLAGLSLFGWTLTLPGIAGIALTIGMAVDANIIIYERIREELKMGQHARKAVEAGFKKAAVAVLDANITTAIAGVVLFSYGDVTIQGFAVTLLMGIATTLLTALFVTRSLLEIVTRRATARLRI